MTSFPPSPSQTRTHGRLLGGAYALFRPTPWLVVLPCSRLTPPPPPLHLQTTERNPDGTTYAERDHFPNGMKVVADYVHAANLSFGLYTCSGTRTCVGNRVGSQDYWSQDATTYAAWGVDWVKMDHCNVSRGAPKSITEV